MTAKRPVVLIVDDERSAVRLMSEAPRNDALTLAAYDGASAIERLAAHPVDVVLSDLTMPT